MSGVAIAICSITLATVLLISGVAKLGKPEDTLRAMRELRLPGFVIRYEIAVLLPWAEIVMAILLFVPSHGVLRAVTVAILALFLTYWLIIAWAMTFSPRPDCHCFGRIGNHQVTAQTVARNSLLLFLAAAIVVGAWQGQLPIRLLLVLELDGLVAFAVSVAIFGLIFAAPTSDDSPSLDYVPKTGSDTRPGEKVTLEEAAQPPKPRADRPALDNMQGADAQFPGPRPDNDTADMSEPAAQEHAPIEGNQASTSALDRCFPTDETLLSNETTDPAFPSPAPLPFSGLESASGTETAQVQVATVLFMADGSPISTFQLARRRKIAAVIVNCGCASTREMLPLLDSWRNKSADFEFHLVYSGRSLIPLVRDEPGVLLDYDRVIWRSLGLSEGPYLLLLDAGSIVTDIVQGTDNIDRTFSSFTT